MNSKMKEMEAQAKAGAEAARILAEALERALEALTRAGVNPGQEPRTKTAKKTVVVQGSAEGLLTKEELRVRLKLPNIEAVERLMRQKKIPFLRFGYRTTRFSITAVDKALARLEVREAIPRKGL